MVLEDQTKWEEENQILFKGFVCSSPPGTIKRLEAKAMS